MRTGCFAAGSELVGEFMYNFKGNLIRKITLGNTFLHNNEIITQAFLENATRFHKIKGTSEIMLSITRKQFFDTLLAEIKTLGTMNVPTLIVWGREERSIPLQTGEKMHHLLTGSRFEVLDQAGHCSNLDQPDIFNQLALDFLTSK